MPTTTVASERLTLGEIELLVDCGMYDVKVVTLPSTLLITTGMPDSFEVDSSPLGVTIIVVVEEWPELTTMIGVSTTVSTTTTVGKAVELVHSVEVVVEAVSVTITVLKLVELVQSCHSVLAGQPVSCAPKH